MKRRSGLLFAVARGRSSEGMNLPDAFCRCVVIVGIPYPSVVDTRVRLKRQVLEETFPGEGRDGQWYTQQASQAINQAVGRIVRHANDYGAVVLIDSRYAETAQFQQLSHWVQSAAPHGRLRPSYSQVIDRLRLFFEPFDHSASPGSIPVVGITTTTKETQLEPHDEPQYAKPAWFRLQGGARPATTTSSRPAAGAPLSAVAPLRKRPPPPVAQASAVRTTKKKMASSVGCVKRKSPGCEDVRSLSEQRPMPATFSIATALRSTTSSSTRAPSPSPKSTQDATLTCQVCWNNRPATEMQRSLRCGHLACTSCWTRMLSRSLECPFCRVKTRHAHLETMLQ